MSEKVLLTGGSGFVGGFVAERLVADGAAVRALVRPTSDTSLLGKLDLELVEGDLRDVDSLTRAAHGCDVICHLASSTLHTATRTVVLRAENVQGAAHVGRAAVEAGVRRIVHGSTCRAYGDFHVQVVDEQTPSRSDSVYAITKLEGERAVADACRDSDAELVIARLPFVLGPRAVRWAGMVNSVARGNFKMIGRGDNWHHTGDARDMAAGLARCAAADGIGGRTYILAGAEPVRCGDLLRMFAEETGAELAPGHLPALPYRIVDRVQRWTSRWIGVRFPPLRDNTFFLTSRRFSIESARRDLGFEPKYDTRQSVRDMVRWLRETGRLPNGARMNDQERR